MAKTMARELQSLRDGEITEDEFARATAGQWDALAERLVRRWELPPAIDAEDARQQLLLALVEQGLVGKWNPARQVELSRYVVWTTCATAKAWLHKQRGAARHRGTARSRFPLSESSLTRQGGDAGEGTRSPISDAACVDPDPERQADAREVVAALFELAPTVRVRTALRALLAAGGREEVAAAIIDGDPEMALDCRIGSRREALQAVRDAVETARSMGMAR